ncbi:ATP-binding protein [soil metagenome]
MATSPQLPAWAQEIIALYESGAASQFIVYGNVDDRFVLPGGRLGAMRDLLLDVLMPQFDVILSYDLGHGVRVERGGETFAQWPHLARGSGGSGGGVPPLPKSPRGAVELITHYLRYVSNLGRLGRGRSRVGVFLPSVSLVAPATPGGVNHDLGALALLLASWSRDDTLQQHEIATFLICPNLNDLHPLLVQNRRAAAIEVPLPDEAAVGEALGVLVPRYPQELPNKTIAAQLAGASLDSVERLLKRRHHDGEPLTADDLSDLKKRLVEAECNGLIEFLSEPDLDLDALHGQDAIKRWIRQDITLWKKGDLKAIPMGYLFCGPVGTGKTFLARCIAGEAGVPVVKLRNFRDRWVGSTESNLETIFRLLHALGRCYVFIDEADQALGKRDSGSGDSGISGRIYSMIAAEMSNTDNRGKILWMLASSRPDLIEVDLKRPGRIDVKIPIFPTHDAEGSFALLQVLCRRLGVEIPDCALETLRDVLPEWLTPGAAEALALKTYRLQRTCGVAAAVALGDSLDGYQMPVSREVMSFQIGLAVDEASDLDFVPAVFQQVAANRRGGTLIP